MEIVTITEARRRLHGALSSYQKETEEVTPEAAVGRITARDITAAHPYPPYRKSPFDGYALCSHEKKAMTSSPRSAPASFTKTRYCPVKPFV
nr:hypothetical protein [uncultured Megasphaera sp.]